MWDTAHRFERAAEREAKDRARKAVLQALGYDENIEPPLAQRFGERLHDLLFYDVAPFFIWILKACFLLFALLLGSVGTYGVIWGLLMRGREVHSRPIFFDYFTGETMMLEGVVALRSTKSAPWVHSCGQESETVGPSEERCIGNGADYEENSPNSKIYPVLASGRRYFFEVTLTLPESEINKQLGVFMVRVDLRSDDRTLLASSKQHSMLPYESGLITVYRKMMLALPLASGFLSETKTITLLCFDNYVDMNEKKPASLVEVSLEIPNPAAFPATQQAIQIHSAELRYGKEMIATQKFLQNWHFSCAFFGIASLFLIYLFTALSICNHQARKNRLSTQPYVGFFDSNGESAHVSNSASHDIWTGADIEILEEEEEEEGSDAWEPIDSKKENPKEPTKMINNLVSDHESFSFEPNGPDMRENTQGRNASVPFPLGMLANNTIVMGHESLFATKSNDEGSDHKNDNSNADNKNKNGTDPKAKTSQEEEEKHLVDMVMKGQSKWDFCRVLFLWK